MLPNDDEVAEVRASLREFQNIFLSVPEFVVPVEHVSIILGWLRPTIYVRKPWSLDRNDELGEIIIRTNAGQEFRLRFYFTGKNPAILTAGTEDQFYGRGHSNEGWPVDGGMQLRLAVENSHKAIHQ